MLELDIIDLLHFVSKCHLCIWKARMKLIAFCLNVYHGNASYKPRNVLSESLSFTLGSIFLLAKNLFLSKMYVLCTKRKFLIVTILKEIHLHSFSEQHRFLLRFFYHWFSSWNVSEQVTRVPNISHWRWMLILRRQTRWNHSHSAVLHWSSGIFVLSSQKT